MFGVDGNFYDNQKYIKREYEEAVWDADSGKDPAVMEKELREAFSEGEKSGRPYPLVLAEGFSYILQNGRLSINPHTIFPEKICHGVTFQPWARAGILEKLSTEHFNEYLDKALPGVRKMRILSAITGLAIPDLDVWHTVLEWESLIDLGFSGLLERSKNEKKKKKDDNTLTEEQDIFYQSVEISLCGVLTFIERLSDAAHKAGMKEIGDTYRALMTRAPETLFEVLTVQHIAMTAGELARERIRSYGHIDKLWAPFYERDLKEGRLDEEKTREMLRYFLTKIAAENRYANQPIAMGGYCKEGSYELEITMLFLDEYQKLKIQNPKLQIRCPKDMPRVLLEKLMDMTRSGSSSIIMFNDEVVIKAYEKVGVPREIAEKYLPMGCNETVIPGVEEMHICSSWINLTKGVEYAMTGGEDLLRDIYLFGRSKEPQTWDEFLEIYFEYLRKFAEFTLDTINKMAPHSYKANPSPFISSTMTSCIESGKDIFNKGLKLRNESVKVFAIGTAVDSLLAVKKFVYERKEITLSDFAKLLKNNWQGGEELRAKIKNDPIKWGNGEEEADQLAAKIYKFMAGEIIGKPTANGGVFRMGGDSVNFAERYGVNTGASADGRAHTATLSKNIRPTNGCEHKGISGLLNSFAAVDWTDLCDGAPCDFMLHPTAVEGDAGLEFMCSIINIFFANGGFCIQGNVIDIDTLLAAKKDPNSYRDLQVRVCGWNEYFVNMTAPVQSDFIKRTSGGRYA